jgi:glycosyltransferase involved in cell wall biosynthesis
MLPVVGEVGEEAVAGSRRQERLRVLHLIKGLTFGGAEQLVLLFAQARDRGHFDMEVAYVLRHADQLAGPVAETGVRVHCLGATSHYDLGWLMRLRRLLWEGCYDVIHLHLPYSAGLGRLVARSLPASRRPKIVHTQHNIWPFTASPVRLLDRLTFGLDDADLAVSHSAWAAMPAPLRARTEVLIHGLDLARLRSYGSGVREEIRAELGVRPGDVLVATVANLRPEKGYDVLLPAAKRVIEEGLPVRFVAVGSGPLLDRVMAQRDALGLGDHFTLTGFRQDGARLIAGSDIFVLSSHHEAFPVAVMEALALGVPVVATAVGDIPATVIEGREGLLVPPGDPVALAGALRSLVVAPGTRARMAQAARVAGSRFDVRSAVDRVEKLYMELAGPTAGPAVPAGRPLPGAGRYGAGRS